MQMPLQHSIDAVLDEATDQLMEYSHLIKIGKKSIDKKYAPKNLADSLPDTPRTTPLEPTPSNGYIVVPRPLWLDKINTK